MENDRQRLIADLSLLAVAIVWGTTFVVVKESLESTPVFAYLFYRFAIAFLVLSPWFYTRRKQLNAGLIRSGILLGLLYFGAFGTQTLGLASIGASISAFLTGLYVVLVPLAAWSLFGRRPRHTALYASVLALIGLWFLTAPQDSNGALRLGTGEWLTLLCALLFALHIVATDHFTRRYDTWLLVGVQFLTVTLLSGLSSLLFEPFTWPKVWNDQLLFSLAITGVFATAFALLVQTRMQRYTTPTRTAIIFAMEPVSAAFFGVLYAGEDLSLSQVLGGMLIVAAMLLAEWGGVRSKE